jgi:multidrug transporter EmrE-like cation transporter
LPDKPFFETVTADGVLKDCGWTQPYNSAENLHYGGQMRFVYLFLSVAFNVASYLLYKSISNKQDGILWIAVFASGLVLGGINVLFFTKALKDLQLSIAYPVFSGACIFLIALFSHAIFGERISTTHVAGAAVIVLGIALLSN